MGVVTVSTSASRTPFGLSSRFSTCPSATKRVTILAFKMDKTKNRALVSSKESVTSAVETSKENPKKLRRIKKPFERVQALSTAEAPSCPLELDYNEAAAKLDRIYKLSPTTTVSDTEDSDPQEKRGVRRSKKIADNDESESRTAVTVVRSRRKKLQRLSLQKRIDLNNKKDDDAVFASMQKRKHGKDNEDEKVNRLVRDYSASSNLGSLDWKKMKFPPVLSSSEHIWLFKLMQPMKAILPVKGELHNTFGREPTDQELAEATNMSVGHLRKDMEVGLAARSKLIKHNLRLVLFVMNKYFQEFVSGPKFQDLCQAGVKGLITAIDRFEPGRKLRLSTYGMFWIRHFIIRSMTLSSFTKVSFGLESVRLELRRAKEQLLFELQRFPTEEEMVKKVGITHRRFHEVMKASRPIYSLNSRHPVTQEEYINGITDHDNVGGNRKQQPALLRLALDDVLDSLKPKESLVIRQRFGLDGKGKRSLGEIAGNLNISREMVRKHELKALMKLRHPARVDYLRGYIS